jgi:tripeptidyl-peptidase I
MAVLEAKLLDVSNPHSRNYGKYLTHEQIAQLSADPDSEKEITKFLESQGISVVKTSKNKGYITAEGNCWIRACCLIFLTSLFLFSPAPVSKWEEVLGTEFFLYMQTDLNANIVRAEDYSLPEFLAEHIESVFNVVQFPGRNSLKTKHVTKTNKMAVKGVSDGTVDPALLNTVYDIRSNTGSANASQAVIETGGSILSTDDLTLFQTTYNLPEEAALVGKNASDRVVTSCTGGNCARANLDVQYMMAVSQDTPTTFMYWNGTDFWLDWIESVADMANPPLVISIGYAENEHEISASMAEAFNNEAMKLSLAGVTLVAASGDDGVSGPDARNDARRCGFFPQFPATSPYVVSVGATMVRTCLLCFQCCSSVSDRFLSCFRVPSPDPPKLPARATGVER